ncbi:ATP-binding protein [Kitasatospora sp. NPDC058201]|uniref:ATP-binding protein n=1 Tax=unclassified Kitasatospora TaxID=2633591 RepID=UPI00365EFC9D
MNDLGDGKASSGVRGYAFAGREREMRALLGAVSGKRPAVVLVEGEAGIGKSRLVAEASTVLGTEGLRVLVGGCHPLREPLAYGPVVDALRRVGAWLPSVERLDVSAGALAPLLPDLAGALPPPPPAPPDSPGSSGQRSRVASGVRTLLEAVAPTVLVVEDVHWADEATRELLLLLARDMPADAALVLTYRAEDLPVGRPVLGAAFRRPPGTGGAEIRLGPLGEPELRAMARDVLGDRPKPTLVRALLQRSGGLPLVIEEDLVTLAAVPRGTDLTVLRVPRSLSEVLAERRARLGPDAAALVNAAAVLAVPAGQSLLADVAGLDGNRGEAALLEALGGAVLRPVGPDSYGFGHALAQEAVYGAIPGPVRNRAHRRILQVLLSQEPPPLVQIAHHSRALGDLAAWLPRAQAAADQATAVGDHGTAAALLQEILDQPGLTSEQLTRAALAMAVAAHFRTDRTASVAALRRIMLLPGLPTAARGQMRSAVAMALMYQEGDPGGEEEMLTALSEVEESDPVSTARMLGLLGVSRTGRFSLAEQRAMVERGFALPAAGEDHYAQMLLHLARFGQQCVAADPAAAELVAMLPRESDDVQILQGTAIFLTASVGGALPVGNDRSAAQALAEATALVARTNMQTLDLHLRTFRVVLDWQAGRWDEAERGLESFHERYPDRPLDAGGLLATVRGLVAAARGRTAQAADAFEQVLIREGVHLDSLGAAAGAARLHLNRDDPQAAWRALTDPHDFLAFLDRKEAWAHAWDLVPTAVETLLALDRTDEAEALTARHTTGAEGRDAPGAVAEHHLCHGLLLAATDPGAAMAAFDLAAARWTAIGRPYPAALATERAARTRTDLDDVSARLTAPITTFEHLGATSDAARCHRTLRELGKATSNPRGRAGYGDRLSPREEQIRDLLTTGATNKDIAAALFLSTRTVENHVARVLAKLRTTRADLTDPPG